MSLLSANFILLLTVFTALYWTCPKGWRLSLAALAGLLGLIWVAPVSAAICLVLTLMTYVLAPRIKTLGRAYGIAVFLFASLVVGRELALDFAAQQSILPWLGAAFYTLRAIHYLLASVQRQLPAHTLADYLRYMFFPPALLIGPVQRFADFEREARRSRFDPHYFSAGLERLLFGYAKIVLFANYLVATKFSYWVNQIPEGAVHSYLHCLEYGLNLYFKFAGYSDIAIGFALLLGIRLPENFNFPFFARNIAEFWKRWHISVSTWCRDHVNYPLYARYRSSAVAALAAMLVLGLWHESSARYLLWGAYHGVGIMIWQRWKAVSLPPVLAQRRYIGAFLSWFVTFNFVVIGFAITSAPDVTHALQTLSRLIGL